MNCRMAFAAGLLCLISLPAFAGPREDTLAGISRCAGLPDDRTFLDCVYGAAQPMRAALGLPPAPSFQTRLVPPGSGRAPAAAIPPSAAASDTVRMAAYSFDGRGHFTVTLSDGEVWRQRAYDQNFANWRGPASDYYVTVRGNPGGDGFHLVVKGDTGDYQIERVR